jgi:hypothetical protein
VLCSVLSPSPSAAALVVDLSQWTSPPSAQPAHHSGGKVQQAAATMNGQAAFVSAFHYQHPTQDGFGDEALLAAPASAAFSGGLPLPFRPPAALPALYNHHAHAHVHGHQQQQQPHQLSPDFAAFAPRPLPLRMATFAQDDAELARLQELSNKWESDATVSTIHCHVCPHMYSREQGPLVSERLASSEITTEYANADPVFQAKTAVCFFRHILPLRWPREFYGTSCSCHSILYSALLLPKH